MTRKIRFVFNDAVEFNPPAQSHGLIYAIRTDAGFATKSLKKNLVSLLSSRAPNPTIALDTERYVDRIVHDAYRIWGHDILRTISKNLNYEPYGAAGRKNNFLQVHFYNAVNIAEDTFKKARRLIAAANNGHEIPALYISLDNLIHAGAEHFAELAFSRSFSLEGNQQEGYVSRPGTKPIEEQIDGVRDMLQSMKQIYGKDIPVVLVEDNIRHARMLNWLIQKMDDQHVFDHGNLAGVATCFCCAPDKEREAIQFRGKTVPLAVSVDYKDANMDVSTPRDLLFDGYVVNLNDKFLRLPAIFMDEAKMFKIHPQKKADFSKEVRRTNMEFLMGLQDEFGVTIPLSWFEGHEAISEMTGCAHDVPMIDAIDGANKKTVELNPPLAL